MPLILALMFTIAFSQKLNDSFFYKKKVIPTHLDTIYLDTIAFFPNSIKILPQQNCTLEYKEIWWKGIIIVTKRNCLLDSVEVTYKPIYVKVPDYFSLRDEKKIIVGIGESPYREKLSLEGEDSRLNKRGTLGRTIFFGNNQEVGTASDLNLQIDGEISQGLFLKANISDQNIPVQPEGTSFLIQEVDVVNIEIYDSLRKLTAGDIHLKESDSYFLKINKKMQGFSLFGKSKNYLGQGEIGFLKGKWARNEFLASEGNRGPYKLKGNNNEVFITVISGTEKVYLNGSLLKRGEDNDYIINYNTGEIIFTPKVVITHSSRIIVEFQYADFYYRSYLYKINGEARINNWTFAFQRYLEKDTRKSLIYSENDTNIINELANAGNNVPILKNIYKQTPYDTSKILYIKKDTQIGTIIYKDIYVYSPYYLDGQTYYEVFFSYTGKGKGNYILDPKIANGRVYTWIPPVNGIPQGEYEPVALLIPPKSKSMDIFSLKYKTEQTDAFLEIAHSAYDKNLYSKLGNDSNHGFGAFLSANQKFYISKKTTLNLGLTSEKISGLFTPIENYRNVEFTRLWNTTKTVTDIHGFSLTIMRPKNIDFQSKLQYIKGDSVWGWSISQNFATSFDRFYHSNNLIYSKSFEQLSHRTALAFLPVFSFDFSPLRISYQMPFEKRKGLELTQNGKYKDTNFTSLESKLLIDYILSEEFFIKPSYSIRYDFITSNIFPLYYTTYALNASVPIISKKNTKVLFSINGYLRKKSPRNTPSPISNFDTRLSLTSPLLSANFKYSLENGFESEQTYHFVEVPPGQGSHVWIDRNNNKIKELDEFEVARFPDEAKYIKVFTPSGRLIPVSISQVNLNTRITPTFLIQGLLINARYSKNIKMPKDIPSSPTFSSSETFNFLYSQTIIKTHSGCSYAFTKTSINSFLYSGNEIQNAIIHSLSARQEITQYFQIEPSYELANKYAFYSEFPSRNYKISSKTINGNLTVRLHASVLISTKYAYTIKINSPEYGGEILKSHILSFTTSMYLHKITLTTKVEYILNNLSGNSKSAPAYIMMEGLNPGKNIVWNASPTINISSSFIISANYIGRISPTLSYPIHNFSIQGKWVF